MRDRSLKVLFVGTLEAPLHAALRDLGASVEAVPGTSALELLAAARRLKPTVLHAREALVAAALVARGLSVPCVVEAHPDKPLASQARASRIASRTICSGPAWRDALLGAGGVPARTTLARGLLACQPRRAAADGERVIACAAPADQADRGVADLLLAFLSVARARPSARLHLAGPGAESAARAAETAGLPGRIRAVSASPDALSALFASAHAVVGPSRSPSFADAIPEAMAAGAPVVATAVGPHPAWVRDGRNGFLVPPHAPVALAARLAQLLDEPALAARLGEASAQLARDASTPRALAMELKACWTQVTRPLSLYGVGLLQGVGGKTLQSA